ncbi:MAG: U32 family peptidase [Alphaproteobacteria bacterium]|nr:U32 family peptidase [Alphaproteobacteria bacterium]
MTARINLGPLFFHWPSDQMVDFYARIADEADIDTVYLGEVICSKRIALFEKQYDAMRERLLRGGKKVVFSTLAEVAVTLDRKHVKAICERENDEIEANDASALTLLKGRPFRIGQLFNCYNIATLDYLVKLGATHVTVPVEMRAAGIAALAKRANEHGIGTEVQVFGRAPLALSIRCYAARARDRQKDNCQFVCNEEPDGLDLHTLDNGRFLTINGIQTLSRHFLSLAGEVTQLMEMGVTHLRLSPHTGDMVKVAAAFRRLVDGHVTADEAQAALNEAQPDAVFSNGFFHKMPGRERVGTLA